MALEEYRRKRDFRSTPEPPGAVDGAPLGGTRPRDAPIARPAAESFFPGWNELPVGRRFCVQQHRATRLHFDVRLEHEGVLLSWACPRGPSLDPGQRRLAVHVEDHPVDYGDFEGVIPSGYGMGTVQLWDAGSFRWRSDTATDVAAALARGDLKFILDGQKLRGEFALVRTSGRGRGTDQRSWLMIKKRDEHVVPGMEAIDLDVSVKTGRSIDAIAADHGGDPRRRRAPARPRVEGPDRAAAAEAAKAIPDFQPMLAVTADRPFDGDDWLFELKLDGVRALVTREGDRLTVRGRSGRDETARYPEAQVLLTTLDLSAAVVDAEVIAVDATGRPSFELLQRRINVSGARDIARVAAEVPAQLAIFDLLWADGRDLTSLPLEERKARLRAVLRDSPTAAYVDHVRGAGVDFFRAVHARGLEGMVAKRRDAPYRPGRRSDSWAKIKSWQTQECVIGGFTEGRGRRADLGALVIGVREGDRLLAAGQVGSGLGGAAQAGLLERLRALRVDDSPFSPAPKPSQPVSWVRAELVCEVRHAGWTAAGVLRHPTFRGLRPDRVAADCVRETTVSPEQLGARRGDRAAVAVARPAAEGRNDASVGAPPAPTAPGTLDVAALLDTNSAALEALAALPAGGGLWEVAGRRLKVTNLDKLLWPEDGVSKRDMIAYYTRMAPVILPYLRDRAVGMQMFPDGISGKHFWRKEVPPNAPEWIRTWDHHHDGRVTRYIIAEEVATLAFMANQGSVDLHPWHSRIDEPQSPDWAVFDLDPFEPMTFAEVVDIAKLVRTALDVYSVNSLIKTSGQTGLQIYVPLRRGPGYEAVRGWVEEVARAIGRVIPDKISWEWSVARRTGRLRIDYTQNILNKTLAAPYSLRPAPGAPVSMPIAWAELDDPGMRPDGWNITTAVERLRRQGDSFRGVLAGDQGLPA
ncbi:MAG: DNA ligase D [Candidatus Dormibacteria bacterium]